MVLLKVRCSKTWNENDNEDRIKRLENLTLTRVVSNESYSNLIDKIRLDILEKIKNVYRKINPYIFYESIIVAIGFIIISVIKKENVEQIIILIGTIGLYLCRIFIITFTSVTMYTSAINVMYLSVTYVIQSLFALLVNLFFIKEIKK